MGGHETMTKRFTVDENGYFDKQAMRYVTIDYLMDLVNEQDQRIKELTEDNKQYEILVESLKDKNQKLKLRLKDLGVEYY